MSRRLAAVLAPPPSSDRPPGTWRRSGFGPWSRGPARPTMGRAEPMPGPLLLELVAAVVEGGAPPHAALAAVGTALREVGDPRGEQLLRAASRVSRPAGLGLAAELDGAERGGGTEEAGTDPRHELVRALEEALLLAARAGLPPTALLRRAAAEERRREFSAQLRAIRRLEVLLVIPAGLCLLPAFVLLGIVPLVINLITG